MVQHAAFSEAHPTLKERVDTFTSILTPDTKAIAFWAMEPEKWYDRDYLNDHLTDFAGGHYPLSAKNTWSFFDPPQRGKESRLYTDGFIERRGRMHRKTPLGHDIGDPLVARAVSVVAQSDQQLTLRDVFGSSHSSGKVRRGFSVAHIIRYLAEHPESPPRIADLAKELDINRGNISVMVKALDAAGIVIYSSPSKEKNREWAQYHLTNMTFLTTEEDVLFEEVAGVSPYLGRGPRREGYVLDVIRYVKDHPTDSYERHVLGERLDIPKNIVSSILSALLKRGYLTAPVRGGGKGRRRTLIQGNEKTFDLWKVLLEPLYAVAETVDPSTYPHFEEYHIMYQAQGQRRKSHVKAMLDLYRARWLKK